MNKLFAVYGTLKKGHYNDRVLGRGELLGTQRITGFKMHSLGAYPAVVKSQTDSIEIEVYRVVDEDTIGRLYRLEGHIERGHKNNMYEVTDVLTEWGQAEIFYMDRNLTCPVIETGVWEMPTPAVYEEEEEDIYFETHDPDTDEIEQFRDFSEAKNQAQDIANRTGLPVYVEKWVDDELATSYKVEVEPQTEEVPRD